MSVSELENFWSLKISLYAQARQLPLLQTQSSVWNRWSFLNSFLMFLHKLNAIFCVNWTWISDWHLVFWKPYPSLRASCQRAPELARRLTVPVSQDSNEYAYCKLREFVHNNTKPFFRIAWHFWTNTKYSGEVSLIISVDIHQEFTLCVRTWIWATRRLLIGATSLYAQARQSLPLLTPRQYLQSLEIS